MNKFKRLVILDKIILLENQWKRLRKYADEVVEFSGLSPDELIRKLHDEMEQNPVPMCWTQLSKEDISKEELKQRIKDADAIITCWTNLPDDVILENPQIRYIGFWTNLVQHRINLDLVKNRGICVTSIPDYGVDSVAELTFSGILSVSRKLLRAHKNTLRGKWPYELLKSGQYIPKVDEIPQRVIRGKKLGIMGLGRIGKRVAEIALGFKMQIQYWSKRRHSEYEALGLKFVELEELFSTSDIVTIHLSPYAPQKIVSSNYIKRLKNGAIFINTSSGTLVDQEALFHELQSGRIFAFLDVYESLPPRKVLRNINTLDNVFTYRAGWYTQESITYKGERLLNNIKDFLTGYLVHNTRILRIPESDKIQIPCNR